MLTKQALAAMIDHTLLKADARRSEIRALCVEALQLQFASVCVNSFWVSLVASELAGSKVKTCTVVGFPLGAGDTEAKVAETAIAIRQGAQEIDMVLNIGALRGGELSLVEDDIAAVVQMAHDGGALVKVILENAYLDEMQKTAACKLAIAAGADFVKTSTGFAQTGATVADVALMRRVVGPAKGVKASGGIRTLEHAMLMVDSGANRLGTSSGVKIVEAAS